MSLTKSCFKKQQILLDLLTTKWKSLFMTTSIDSHHHSFSGPSMVDWSIDGRLVNARSRGGRRFVFIDAFFRDQGDTRRRALPAAEHVTAQVSSPWSYFHRRYFGHRAKHLCSLNPCILDQTLCVWKNHIDEHRILTAPQNVPCCFGRTTAGLFKLKCCHYWMSPFQH